MVIKSIIKGLRYINSIIVSLYNWCILKLNRINNLTDCSINGRIYIRNYGSIKIGTNVVLNSSFNSNPIGFKSFTSIIVNKYGSFVIGNFSGLSNVSIVCSKNITIGNYVFIGADVKIYDTDFHSIHHDQRIKGYKYDNDIQSKSIIINDNVFIGTSSIILKGVEIGRNSVIGAGSVVSRNIPPFEIWAGNPIKFIRKIND